MWVLSPYLRLEVTSICSLHCSYNKLINLHLKSADRKFLRSPERKSSSLMRIGSKEVQIKWKFNPMSISSISQRSTIKQREHSLTYKGDTLNKLRVNIKQLRFKNNSVGYRALNKPKNVAICSMDFGTHLNLPKSRDPDCDSSNLNDFSQYMSKIL